jgi:YfiH family protein
MKLNSLSYKVFDKYSTELTHLYSPDINPEDQKIILKEMNAEKLAILTQKHSDIVCYVDENYARADGDAMVTDKPNIALGIQTADCVCVLLASSDQKVIGAAHLGWKGAASNLLDNTIKLMREFSQNEIMGFIAPCIRQSSYEVDQGFFDNFIASKPSSLNYFESKDNKLYFNLPGFVTCELNERGVFNVEDSNIGTYGSDRYFSFRFSKHQGLDEKRRILSCIVK